MRVLLVTRPDHATRAGGDAVVIETLRALLAKRGHRVFIGADAAEARHMDLVHLFNVDLLPHVAVHAHVLRKAGRPYVITPLYWPLREAAPWHAYVGTRRHLHRWCPPAVIDYLAGLQSRRRWATATPVPGIRGRSRDDLRRDVLMGAAAVAATGQAEREQLLTDYPALDPQRVHVVRLGYHPVAEVPPVSPIPEPGFVLCVGSIGPRKNQLGLARAVASLPNTRLVCIGQPAYGGAEYVRRVRAAAPSGSVFLPDQPHGSLPAFYRHARVVAQPSFIELPGLVAIEAVACARPVVIADRRPMREYFGDLVTRADPSRPEAIARACADATAPAAEAVAAFTAAHRWEATVDATERMYVSVGLSST